ncbi:MAG: N-formylglutamate amidohydrolase [Halocynthiibacter sp.]
MSFAYAFSMSELSYFLNLPDEVTSEVIIASPHSGRGYPPDFVAASDLTALQLRSSEDAFMDILTAEATRHGMRHLAAYYPRAYVDLNRNSKALDPALIEGAPAIKGDARIQAGLGVIPRVVAHNQVIQNGKMSIENAHSRLDQAWHPYHACLAQNMDQNVAQFGRAILMDFHSMPHGAVSHLATPTSPAPEIVIGDREGRSADRRLSDTVEGIFKDHGFLTRRNVPFSGAYISNYYGKPKKNWHAIQVEIDRSLYMDEMDVRPSADFNQLQARLEAVLVDLAQIGAHLS